MKKKSAERIKTNWNNKCEIIFKKICVDENFDNDYIYDTAWQQLVLGGFTDLMVQFLVFSFVVQQMKSFSKQMTENLKYEKLFKF